ncbi:MAG: (d)CMP kinase [Cryomorphaceae bacterium]|nr:(d)CMP kinase [Cryomorphaceae bacterium]
MTPIIAIDGFSSTGKSTIAKGLAKKLQLIYIDSGAMYRAITLFALQNGLIDNGKIQTEKLVAALPKIRIAFTFNAKTQKSETLLNGEQVEDQIRQPHVAAVVSEVSAIPEVRRFLVEQQRALGERGGLVMDGRDIGTVVFPKADVKIFTTASEEIRVERRWTELQQKGEKISKEAVRENLLHRDHIDATRKDSPLIKADDAVELDNTNLTLEAQLEWAVRLVLERMGQTVSLL